MTKMKKEEKFNAMTGTELLEYAWSIGLTIKQSALKQGKAHIIEQILAAEPEQAAKPRNNLKLTSLTYKGETKSIKEWADQIGMPRATLYDRVNRNGWTTEEALTIPLGERRK